jgi:hypothetical protein
MINALFRKDFCKVNFFYGLWLQTGYRLKTKGLCLSMVVENVIKDWLKC